MLRARDRRRSSPSVIHSLAQENRRCERDASALPGYAAPSRFRCNTENTYPSLSRVTLCVVGVTTAFARPRAPSVQPEKEICRALLPPQPQHDQCIFMSPTAYPPMPTYPQVSPFIDSARLSVTSTTAR